MGGLAAARVVVFDIDDTLYLERDYARSGFRAVGRHVEEVYGRPGFAEACLRHFESGARGDLFDRALEELGLPRGPNAVGELVDVYRAHAPEIELLPDAREVLSALHGARDLAVISDGPLQSQQRKADALGLSGWASLVVLTDAWGREYWKPNERAFAAVEAHFGVRGADCVYVADNPEKDFLGPRARGWVTIRVRRSGGLHAGVEASGAADRELACLREIPLYCGLAHGNFADAACESS